MIEKLKSLTIANKNNKTDFPYINLDADNNYNGWVTDFHLRYAPTNEMLSLDLHNDFDLFLLFVLSSAWSRPGYWEDALFFVAYLKTMHPDVLENGVTKDDEDLFVMDNYIGVIPRKKVSFRKDIYPSLNVLRQEFGNLKQKIQESVDKNNWLIFVDYISNISGLGAGDKKMKIKIPFILRELACQKIYPDIPGELCCVVDARVRKAYKELNISLPTDYLKASGVIYNHFEHLYDIPAFAYDDFKKRKQI